MTAGRRWALLAVGLLLLVGVPVLVSVRPVADPALSATALGQRIRASQTVAFTGLTESRGRVSLPTGQSLTSLATLLGDTHRVRVWWQSPDVWRTATLRTTGETDLLHRDGRTLRWVYESKRVTLSPDVAVRLPHAGDLLPPVLARRLLTGAEPGELSRLPAARVAGRAAAGLRLTPSQTQSSVARVDVWADTETGLPLRVEVVGDPAGPPALTSAFTEVSFTAPSRDDLSFVPPDDASVRFDDTVDLAAAADKYADRSVPATLAGLPARAEGVRSVGVYGRGPTLLLAVPLRESDAHRLREEVRGRPGAACLRTGWRVGTGPLQLMVTVTTGVGSWLLAGTVTADAVEEAARELRRAGGRFFVVTGVGAADVRPPTAGRPRERCP